MFMDRLLHSTATGSPHPVPGMELGSEWGFKCQQDAFNLDFAIMELTDQMEDRELLINTLKLINALRKLQGHPGDVEERTGLMVFNFGWGYPTGP